MTTRNDESNRTGSVVSIDGAPFTSAEEALKFEKAVGSGMMTVDTGDTFLVVEPDEFSRMVELGIKFSFLVVDPETEKIEHIPVNECSRYRLGRMVEDEMDGGSKRKQ